MYKAVLIVPDIYNRGHLRELMNLLLLKMGFGSCFLVQVSKFLRFILHHNLTAINKIIFFNHIQKDHVAATFGAGLGYACVVDVGDQKTSVSCVEDGISHPSTRVRLNICSIFKIFFEIHCSNVTSID